MKISKIIFNAVLAIVSSGLIAPAFADRGDIYGGIGYGINSIDAGARIFGGYTIHDQLKIAGKKVDIGVEATYLDLGSTSIAPGVVVTEKNLGATAVGSIEVFQNTRVFARAGIGQAQGDLKSAVMNDSKTGLVPIFGVGASYALGNNFGARADIERITGMYENATSLSASVYIKF